MLCTSGFVDDVVFSHNGAESKTVSCVVVLARWRDLSKAAPRGFAFAGGEICDFWLLCLQLIFV